MFSIFGTLRDNQLEEVYMEFLKSKGIYGRYEELKRNANQYAASSQYRVNILDPHNKAWDEEIIGSGGVALKDTLAFKFFSDRFDAYSKITRMSKFEQTNSSLDDTKLYIDALINTIASAFPINDPKIDGKSELAMNKINDRF